MKVGKINIIKQNNSFYSYMKLLSRVLECVLQQKLDKWFKIR